MLGQCLGHYRIVEKIGAGGMGVVYAARDERLDREVAVKVLPSSALEDPAVRRRFRHEAQIISRLNHPNIATVHDFDTQDNTDFLVMELVPGLTLNQKIAAGPLPEKEALRLGIQLASGLVAAHAAQVIHRDLKPGNLRVTPDGRLKILDFGLAKAAGPFPGMADTASISEARWVAGTLPYMAPEQVRDQPPDVRSDVYSAGAVMYEMTTGRRPFPDVGPVLVDKILHATVEPPRALNPEISPGLEAVILKALDKDPERRYQSAKELLVDLERLSEGSSVAAVFVPQRRRRTWRIVLAVAAILAVALLLWRLTAPRGARANPIQSLAVLPLENLSGDPSQAYFADGMTEALINELAKIGALRVISRTSAMRYKDVKEPLPQIARELNVDAVVEGSVLRSGNRVRISAELIQGSTDKALWSNSYQREMRDVLSLQGDVAGAIAREIRITVQPQERERLASARPVDPEAYEAYLKGRYYWNRRTGEDIQKSIDYFQQAVKRDPTYALAYSGLADAYHVFWVYTNIPPRQNHAEAKAAALKAIELDGNLAEAHTSLAAILVDDDLDFTGAESEFRRALALNPNYSTARHWFAQYLTYVGKFDEAIAEIRKAQELDPLSPIINTAVGDVFMRARRYDQAIDQLNKAIALDRNFYLAHRRLSEVYLAKAMFGAGIEQDKMAALLAGMPPQQGAERAETLRKAYADGGPNGFWSARLKLALEHLQAGHNQYDASAYLVASDYAHLGEDDEAFRWLEKAFEQRDDNVFYFNSAAEFDRMRQQPRGRDLLRRIGIPGAS